MVWRQEKILRTNYVLNSASMPGAGTFEARRNLCPSPQAASSNDGANYPVVADASVGRTGAGSSRSDLTTSGVDATINPGNALVSVYGVGGVRLGTQSATPGTWYAFSCYVSASVASTGQVSVLFRNSSGQAIVTARSDWATVPATSGSTWVRLSVVAQAPDGAVDLYTSVTLLKNADQGRVTTNDHGWVCDALLEARPSVLSYFSGSYSQEVPGLTVTWAGTANASASIATGTKANAFAHNGNYSSSYLVTEGSESFVRLLYTVGSASYSTGAYYDVSRSNVPAGHYTYSCEVRASSPDSVGKRIRPALYSSPDEKFLTNNQDAGLDVVLTSNWQRVIIHTVTPHSGNGGVLPYFYANGILPTQLYTTDYDIRRPILTQGFDEPSFFNGNTLNKSGLSYRWQGSQSASVSEQYLAAMLTPTPGSWASWDAGFAESWFVDGIDIQSYAFGIEKLDSIPPEMRGAHTTLPNVSGVIPRFNRTYDAGSVTLKMWVLGCDTDGTIPSVYSERRQLFERNMRMLHRLFGYQGNTIELRRIYIGDYVGAAPTTVTTRAIISGFSGLETMMARQRAELTVELTLIDAFWSDVTPTTDASSASATLPKTVNLSDVGTAPIDDAVMSIVGPIVAPKVTCPSSGSWVQYTGTVAANQTLVIDSGKGTATLNGVSVLSNILHGGSARLMIIPPREGGMVGDKSFQTSMTLSGTGGGATTALSVKYNRKHLVMV